MDTPGAYIRGIHELSKTYLSAPVRHVSRRHSSSYSRFLPLRRSRLRADWQPSPFGYMSLRQLQEDEWICVLLGGLLRLGCQSSLAWPVSRITLTSGNIIQHVEIKSSETLRTYRDSCTYRHTTMDRQFCSNCGCAVFWKMEGVHDKLLVAGGTVLAPGGQPGRNGGESKSIMTEWRPQGEFFCSTRVDWVSEIEGTHQEPHMPHVEIAT